MDKGSLLPSGELGQHNVRSAKGSERWGLRYHSANRAANKIRDAGNIRGNKQQSGNCSALDKLRCIDHLDTIRIDWSYLAST